MEQPTVRAGPARSSSTRSFSVRSLCSSLSGIPLPRLIPRGLGSQVESGVGFRNMRVEALTEISP
jgi:hypothetical protein